MIKSFIFLLISSLPMHLFAQTLLTLEQSKALALKNNKMLQNASLEIEAARQLKKEAFTHYFPNTGANVFAMHAIDPMVKFNISGGNLPVYDGNPATLPVATEFAYFPGVGMNMMEKAGMGVLNITQPVYAGGRIRTGNRLAALNVDLKEKQEKLSEREALLKTEQQYWLLVSLQEKQMTLNRYELLLNDVRKQVDDAYKNGLAVRNDVLKVQLKQSELALSKSKLTNGRKLATMQLCQTIGIPYDSTLVLQDAIDVSHGPEQYYTAIQTAIENREEYQLLKKSVEATQLQTNMKRGNYTPTLAVGLAGYHFNTLEKHADYTNNGLAYVTVILPISDWWGGSHAIKEHKIKEQVAKNSFDDSMSLMTLQMEKAWTDLNEAYYQIGVLKISSLQAEENLNVNQSSYNSGVVTLSDLLEAQALMSETSNKLIEAKMEYKLAVTTYLQVTGQSN